MHTFGDGRGAGAAVLGDDLLGAQEEIARAQCAQMHVEQGEGTLPTHQERKNCFCNSISIAY